MLGASNMVNTSCLTRDTRHKTKMTNGNSQYKLNVIFLKIICVKVLKSHHKVHGLVPRVFYLDGLWIAILYILDSNTLEMINENRGSSVSQFHTSCAILIFIQNSTVLKTIKNHDRMFLFEIEVY